MTEQCLQKIIQQAAERWQILEARVIHRVGPLHLSEQIVFVGYLAL
ncbi:molybdenum cofactor biosynthesis protein MoaE [Oleiphilus sp. HI0061]|nr:molybdenum cofactor biosynthesis protein MoaE [Oleiphilus sp. HI0061]